MRFINKIIRLLSSDHISTGLQYFESGDFQNAVGEFTRVISSNPDPSSQDHKLAKFYITESYISLAEESLKKGNTEGARQNYLRVTEFNDYPDVFYKLAKIYFDEGDFINAEDFVLKALRASCNYLRAKLFLAVIRLKQNRVEDTVYYLMDLMDDSMAEFKDELERAVDALKDDDADKAAGIISQIAVDEPKEWVMLIKQGDSYFNEGEYGSALNCYNKAIELKSEYPDYYLKKGNVYMELKKYEDAVASFKKAIELNPDYTQARISLGAVHVILNDFENASKQFSVILDMDPDNEEALINLKELLKKK